jgi:hypothetical protein
LHQHFDFYTLRQHFPFYELRWHGRHVRLTKSISQSSGLHRRSSIRPNIHSRNGQLLHSSPSGYAHSHFQTPTASPTQHQSLGEQCSLCWHSCLIAGSLPGFSKKRPLQAPAPKVNNRHPLYRSLLASLASISCVPRREIGPRLAKHSISVLRSPGFTRHF